VWGSGQPRNIKACTWRRWGASVRVRKGFARQRRQDAVILEGGGAFGVWCSDQAQERPTQFTREGEAVGVECESAWRASAGRMLSSCGVERCEEVTKSKVRSENGLAKGIQAVDEFRQGPGSVLSNACDYQPKQSLRLTVCQMRGVPRSYEVLPP